MKYLFFLMFSLAVLHASAEEKEAPKMKQFFFVMLVKGANRSQDSVTAAKIQKAHLENIVRLGKEGKLVLAGPFGDDGQWRGIFIFDMPAKEDVEKELQSDRAISSGRLAYEIHPWWTTADAFTK